MALSFRYLVQEPRYTLLWPIDSSNIGDYSRIWGHLIDETIDRFIKSDVYVALVSGSGIPPMTWGLFYVEA